MSDDRPTFDELRRASSEAPFLRFQAELGALRREILLGYLTSPLGRLTLWLAERVIARPRRCSECGRRALYPMQDGSRICESCGRVE
jgi:hypothetical protein